MSTLYKLTTQDNWTRKGLENETLWGEGIEHTASGKGELCGPGWLHAYVDPLLAVLLNPIHADLENPKLWECAGDVGKTDHGLKVGCTRLRTIKELPLPEVTTEQRVRFAILCALKTADSWEANQAWKDWAQGWLDGTDRARAAADAAAEAARTARTARAAGAAAWAAGAAAWAARAAGAAAWAAGAAAWAAARAAGAAAGAADIDLIAIAYEAMEGK